MPLNLTINDSGLHQNVQITLQDGKAYVLIGKNGAGKSKLLNSLKNLHPSAVLLTGNYEEVKDISTVAKERSAQEQLDNRVPMHVSSLVASNPTLLKIFKYYFKILFETDLTISGSSFRVKGFDLNQDADGFKAIFNLLYYLISDNQIVLLDEPERFFHPSMKTVFISLVSEIAKNYNKIIVLTSHSNESIRFDLENVEIWILKQPIIKLKSWLQSLTVAGYTARDRTQFTDWISYHTEVFFSKVNYLVEGVSDQIVLHSIKNKMALKYNFENISISHVAASTHEAGGKSRLHKFQAYLANLNQAVVIADKDVIPNDVKKWFLPAVGDTDINIIQNAKAHHLHILSSGEIEDYYFVDAATNFCQTVAQAKANKISAAYEQARIISTKATNEVEVQFQEIVDIFKLLLPLSDADLILKSLSKDYLIDKFGRQDYTQEYIEDAINGDDIEIKFKFAGYGKSMKYPKEHLEKIKELQKNIEDNLH